MKKQSILSNPLCSVVIRILVGGVLLLFPMLVVRVFGYIVGALLFVYGLFLVITGGLREQRIKVLLGAALLILGGVTFFFTDSLLDLLLLGFGLFLLLRGIFYFQLALRYKQLGERAWWVHAAVAAAFVLVALLSFLAPATIRHIVIMILGISLLLDGMEGLGQYLHRRRSAHASHEDGRIYVDSEKTD